MAARSIIFSSSSSSSSVNVETRPRVVLVKLLVVRVKGIYTHERVYRRVNRNVETIYVVDCRGIEKRSRRVTERFEASLERL